MVKVNDERFIELGKKACAILLHLTVEFGERVFTLTFRHFGTINSDISCQWYWDDRVLFTLQNPNLNELLKIGHIFIDGITEKLKS